MSRVLVVEKDDDVRALITEILIQRNYEVINVADGKTAMNWIQLNQFGVIITDVMSNALISGITVARFARERWFTTPIVFISGLDIELAYAADFRPPHACLAKPSRISSLLEALGRVHTGQDVADRRTAAR